MIPTPKGYRFAAVAAGFKKADNLDLGLILSDEPAAAAGLFTKNLFQAAPVLVARETLTGCPTARAVLINSGQANACTGDEGLADCHATRSLVADALGLAATDILPASTGVIGQRMRLDRWKTAMPELAASLGQADPMDFTRAIMTTDSFPKLAHRVLPSRDGGEIRVLGMAKGAGMICPNMATMLGVVLTDARVAPEMWQKILAPAVEDSFNRVTVDGDTSTNDTIFGLANGAAGDPADPDALAKAVSEVCSELAYMLVEDAEGGTRVMRIRVAGASDDAQAEAAARAVGNSPLVKTAIYGRDANWGRIVAALGRSGAGFHPDRVRVAMAGITLFEHGKPVAGDLDGLLAPHLRRQEIPIQIRLGDGPGRYELLASDLTHEYININADYRS
jgi:glutamate N-acetyltransferase / amino-acid N-acetyltransferase